MLVKIADLYINTDRIETIGVFESNPQTVMDYYGAGLCINGQRYTVFTANVAGPVEDIIKEEFRNSVRKIQKYILDIMGTQINEPKLPVPFEEQHKEEE